MESSEINIKLTSVEIKEALQGKIAEKIQASLLKNSESIEKSLDEYFSIDFFQNTGMKLNEEIEDEELSESYSEDIIKSIQYDTSCILQIIKECPDKEIFLEFETDIHQF